jgi:hypothetical protein
LFRNQKAKASRIPQAGIVKSANQARLRAQSKIRRGDMPASKSSKFIEIK